MVPIDGLDQGAPFAAAFAFQHLEWARYIVALGALMGIVTTTLVSSVLPQGISASAFLEDT